MLYKENNVELSGFLWRCEHLDLYYKSITLIRYNSNSILERIVSNFKACEYYLRR